MRHLIDFNRPLIAPVIITFLASIIGWSAPKLNETSGVLVFDGDSIAVGQGASPGPTVATLVAHNPNFHGTLSAKALSGSPASERNRLFEANISPLFDSGSSPKILFFHAGDNDIRLGVSADDTYATIIQYVRIAKGEGRRIVISTEIRRYDFPQTKQNQLSRLSDLIVQSQATADAIFDFSANKTMGRPNQRGNLDLDNADRCIRQVLDMLAKIAVKAIQSQSH